jgi:hypothetical protein
MLTTNLTIMPKDKVLAYDSLLYKNDKDTPLSITMKEATVVCRYGCRSTYNKEWIYPDLVDVIFDHDKRLSKGHFTYGVKLLKKGN